MRRKELVRCPAGVRDLITANVQCSLCKERIAVPFWQRPIRSARCRGSSRRTQSLAEVWHASWRSVFSAAGRAKCSARLCQRLQRSGKVWHLAGDGICGWIYVWFATKIVHFGPGPGVSNAYLTNVLPTTDCHLHLAEVAAAADTAGRRPLAEPSADRFSYVWAAAATMAPCLGCRWRRPAPPLEGGACPGTLVLGCSLVWRSGRRCALWPCWTHNRQPHDLAGRVIEDRSPHAQVGGAMRQRRLTLVMRARRFPAARL